ncbi:THAP domain [Popillia japonica]|uniref:THAP domain n=1 Tax=Popillia japonica TaxID=7064 RepID=A0AAW1JFY5_POPJA
MCDIAHPVVNLQTPIIRLHRLSYNPAKERLTNKADAYIAREHIYFSTCSPLKVNGLKDTYADDQPKRIMGDATTIAKQNEEEGSPPQKSANTKNNTDKLDTDSVKNHEPSESDPVEITKNNTDKLDTDSVKNHEPSESDPVEIGCKHEKSEDTPDEKKNHLSNEVFYLESEDTPDEKKNHLSNEVFYLEVIDKPKSNLLDETLENCPTPTPTPRRVNKLRDHNSTIFPVGCMGCREDPPSDHITSPRRFLDQVEAKDHIGHIDNTPRKRPSSAKPNNSRNPLTGVGVTDDLKKPIGRRRVDGNPLLGEGYETKDATPSCTRIPPDIPRARTWIIACGRTYLLEDLENLHSSYRLCGAHFEKNAFQNNLRNRLHKHAVPTIFPALEGTSQVKYATQVFSATVSAGLNLYIWCDTRSCDGYCRIYR